MIILSSVMCRLSSDFRSLLHALCSMLCGIQHLYPVECSRLLYSTGAAPRTEWIPLTSDRRSASIRNKTETVKRIRFS